jgi:polysaccharide pyruvyl transferase WcaK-like protein
VGLDVLKHTSFPLIIQSVGSYPHKPVTANSLANFRAFLDAIADRCNTKIVLRNDGSFEKLKSLGINNPNIVEGFDNAYLAQDGLNLNDSLFSYDYVALNLSFDQQLMQSEYRSAIDTENFKVQIQRLIPQIIQRYKCKVVLVPHITGDVGYYLDILKGLDDRLVRSHIVIAEYNGSTEALDYYYSIYKKSLFNIATRFHANIFCGMTGVETLSLCILDRVRSITNIHDNLYGMTNFSGEFAVEAFDKISRFTGQQLGINKYSEELSGIYDDLRIVS